MQLPEPPLNASECPVCRAAMASDDAFCSACGTPRAEASVAELRAVMYLLSELERWQADAAVSSSEAAALRSTYERRRDDLRAQITASAEKDISSGQGSDARAAAPQVARPDVKQRAKVSSAEQPVAAAAPPSILFPISQPSTPPPVSQPEPSARRTLVETLAEPYTLRLLLYTGAAMFVVGVIIWLRDVLYLKLQEPVVQAGLLILGTITLTASGWYTILRTRQRLTGRALTLAGSLLVPVNFWFLVRSGLIANHGRAWVVCAFCTLLYAHTAALLREKLYVYLSCAASIATGWALVYRAERDAPGLYALVLMGVSLLFLHLSRMFPASIDAGEAGESPFEDEAGAGKRERANIAGRWSRELWSAPLVYAALTGAVLCAFLYMPLRLGPSLSLYDGIFRLRARGYDSSTAMLLFTGLAYVAWFTGRYIYAGRRVHLYALCALALFWAQFLTMDGLRLSARVQVTVLAATVLAVSLAARRTQSIETARALYIASVFVGLMLTPIAFTVLLAAEAVTLMHSAGFALLAAAFALLSVPRLSERASQRAFAYLAAILASVGFLVALQSASLRSVTLFTAACAAWPFALYAVAWLTQRQRLETQLSAPFRRIADAEFVLLLLWASMISLLLYLSEGNIGVPRAAMFCALCSPLLYGLWRAARESSAFGAGMASLAAIVVIASSLDALQDAGLWPRSWPVAAGSICAAFVLHEAGARWLRVKRAPEQEARQPPHATIRLVMDCTVVLCALLWFSIALAEVDRGGFGGVWVLLLALLYWGERAAQKRAAWPVYLSAAHAGALFLAMLIALDADQRWFTTLFALVLVPFFFAVAGYARARSYAWLAVPASHAAVIAGGLSFVAAILQATPHLQAGDLRLLAPSVTIATLALVSLVVSLLSEGQARVRHFRVGLYLSVIAYALACLRAGFEPWTDVEVYTSPIAILLLIVAYISFRREWNDYARDTSLLFWTGSILLGGPLLLRALQFRLLFDSPAPRRDLATLCASLALLLFGILGRLRAPVIIGAVTLLAELATLALTSVDWLQVPLKIYLVTVGALLAFVGWMFEYRREQLMLIRSRLNERREYARERFGEWR